ncbi:MAG TPA: DUF2179 domain-containing protein [Epulopiscium sp.]|nr:DUF2179 domain-containing protein [Candidatus Epulonipiscium sp.]
MKEIILIILLQLIYVPLLTLRTIFLIKNMTTIAALLGFVEALVYVFGLSLVFSGNQGPLAMFVYAVGYGVGILIGGAIENKLAIGYNSLIVNLMEKNTTLIDHMRNKGFGVTVYEGEGRDSKRYRLDILTKRSREEELIQIIEEYEPKAFIVSYEVRKFQGGFLVSAMKKMRLRK